MFVSCWFQPVVIVILRNCSLLMTGSFQHNSPFIGSGSTWHAQMILHSFLGLSFCCLHCHSGQNSPPRVVCVLGVVVLASFNGTTRHRRWLESLGNWRYPGGYFSSSNQKSPSIVQNQLTWVGTFFKTNWCSCYNFPRIVLVEFHVCCGRVFWYLRCWYGCLKPLVVSFGGFIFPLSYATPPPPLWT